MIDGGDTGDPQILQFVPQVRCLGRQNAVHRPQKRQVTDDDRVASEIHPMNFYRQAGKFVCRLITAAVRRRKLAFQYDLCSCRDGNAAVCAVGHFHRRAANPTGEAVVRVSRR